MVVDGVVELGSMECDGRSEVRRIVEGWKLGRGGNGVGRRLGVSWEWVASGLGVGCEWVESV